MPIQHVNAISNRLSLRTPQRDSLEILDRLCEIVDFQKDTDIGQALQVIQSEFETVTEFDERDFPSLCFALATGVGKTRLMGAFISYLQRAEGVGNFFVLAPNLSIYNKLIADFTPNTPKYVFQGIAEFATRPPEVITGDNYRSGRGVRDGGYDIHGQKRMYDDAPIHINIFNISKINSEVRGGKEAKIKRLEEVIGESYFEYLSGLDDLVLLMDESHRYRASAGVKAINKLKPILGLELTATPQVEKGKKSIPFNNVIYSYPLSKALTDGYIKQPAVATRENFDAANYDAVSLEKLKLKDGIVVHEETKQQLKLYALENGVKQVKPFMLVVAKDTDHANGLQKAIETDLFEGQYAGKVITVHSKTKGEEKDEIIQQLLSVEDPKNPVEIVIHVNMLKEGWDVTNLYTIVPLRAADSRTLVEQSIGRGLRLPYGKRTGNEYVDRLTIVAHDRFQDIVDEANRGDSILVTGVVIGKDIPDKPSKVVTVAPKVMDTIVGSKESADGDVQQPLFNTEKEVEVAKVTLDVIKGFERLKNSKELTSKEIQKQITEKVTAAITPAQMELTGMEEAPSAEEIAAVVKETCKVYVKMTIDIPRIVVVPKGEHTCGFKEFDLDTSGVRFQPVDNDILIQTLRENKQSRLRRINRVAEDKLENYLVAGLIDYQDINYDENAEVLYKLSGQMVEHLKSYLPDDAAVLNVLQAHNKALVRLIHSQMEDNFEESASEYEVHVSKGFTTLSQNSFHAPEDEEPRNFREPVDDKRNIRSMLFGGFSKCLFPVQKFDSDTERRFAVVLETDDTVEKWVKPNKKAFQIDYRVGLEDKPYEPDFVAETKEAYYLCEPKAEDEMDDEVVQTKAKAAATWCENASTVSSKPWNYLLVPHTAVNDSQSMKGLSKKYQVNNK